MMMSDDDDDDDDDDDGGGDDVTLEIQSLRVSGDPQWSDCVTRGTRQLHSRTTQTEPIQHRTTENAATRV